MAIIMDVKIKCEWKFFCFAFNYEIVCNCFTDSGKGKVSTVKVVGCEDVPVCVMKKGLNASLSVTFVISKFFEFCVLR